MTVKRQILLVLCAFAAAGEAYTPSVNPKKGTKPSVAAKAVATAALGVLLATEPASATSKMAAQIQLNSIPPTSVEVNIRDLPLIGDVLSGTYTRVPEPVKNPSVSISSPKDKIGAIKAAATNGHLEFDVSGVLGTHLDIDLAAEEAGVARVRVESNLIPQLPFKNLAASSPLKSTGKDSDWFTVTNMGSGESYYYNEKTGDTTFQKPKTL